MTVEFGRQFRAYREVKFSTRIAFAQKAYSNGGFVDNIEKGKRNVSAANAEYFAEVLGVPLHECALFFLRGAGFSEERISIALDSPYGVFVTTNLPQGEQITAGKYIRTYMMSDRFKNNDHELARAVEKDPSMIHRLKNGKRSVRAPLAEQLVEALQIPPERQAEFLLLVIGHEREIVYQVLTALNENNNIQKNEDLEQGEALLL